MVDKLSLSSRAEALCILALTNTKVFEKGKEVPCTCDAHALAREVEELEKDRDIGNDTILRLSRELAAAQS